MLKKILENNEQIKSNTRTLNILKEYFPDCFTKDEEFDIERFKNKIASDVNTVEDGYELNFLGKNYANLIASQETTTVIEPDIEHNQKKENKNSNNIYISGDNLDAIKHLLNSYSKKIKCIYIDPPYNTNNDEFVYNDSFNFSKEELVNKLDISEERAEKLMSFLSRKSSSHSAWLTFMYPRLLLARDLLTDDGVIFISIDDNEQANLKLLCDSIFGEENYIEQFHIQVRYSEKSLAEKDDFQKLMEYVFIYAKNKGKFIPKKEIVPYNIDDYIYTIAELGKGKEEIIGGKKVLIFKENEYKINRVIKNINNLKSTWASGTLIRNNNSAKFASTYLEQRKEIDGIKCLYKVYGIGDDGLGYRYFSGPKQDKTSRCVFYSGIPNDKKEELSIKGEAKKTLPIINLYDYSADIGNIRNEGGVPYNSGKKPIVMLEKLFEIANLKHNDIVLDFFAGSASTAHAICKMNKQELEINYILVQLNENLELKKQNSKNKVQQSELENIISIISEKKYPKPCSLDQLGMVRIENIKNKYNTYSGFKHFTLKSFNENMLDKIKEFNSINNDAMIGNNIEEEFGIETILTTWINQDGYGLTVNYSKIKFGEYEAYYVCNESLGGNLYLINQNIDEIFIKKLIDKIKNDEKFNIKLIVIFGYNFTYREMKMIEDNIAQLKNSGLNLDIAIDKRY